MLTNSIAAVQNYAAYLLEFISTAPVLTYVGAAGSLIFGAALWTLDDTDESENRS